MSEQFTRVMGWSILDAPMDEAALRESAERLAVEARSDVVVAERRIAKPILWSPSEP